MPKKSTKTSTDLKRKIKKAESEKRDEIMKTQEVKVVTAGADDEKITYNQWWMKINKKVPMRAHLKEIIWADFQARGLTKSETEDKYNETLRVFGIKW